jgi:hypothetical protein
MSASISDLEQDIEASRARLDRTIDRIQDRLTVPGIVDDMLGTVRTTPLSGLYDAALVAVRRNPIPVALIAAGIGWLAYRTSSDAQRRAHLRRTERAAERTPVLRTNAARTYDPDAPVGPPRREPAPGAPLQP